ncbi:DUF368 domain-containing protein [Evansella sp. AB-P1]|uniref:DUF368 domain-containing protein n=1 Tax=Evansella sp. AB-P1 TaxID=3037653 RepID=UPI00241F8C34|nr:DUF368 domain-containing protein [Evansella sp. AB-P1]MDG5786442.1 DUF368 domain-containing protein [Evansella sp. AB-P1]
MMGITELVPGVSSGTIAVVLGIYDQLIVAINGLFSKEWKKHLAFLIPLGVGMVIAILSFVKLIRYLLDHHQEPTHFFFLGLIIGVLPLLIRKANVKATFGKGHYIALSVAAILVGMLEFVPKGDAEAIVSLTVQNTFGLFFSGWLASVSMLLPGISGSLVFLILGVYDTATLALDTFNFPIIIVIGSGVVFGFFVSSKVIKYLLKNFHYMTYAVIIGLVLGSTIIIYPGISSVYVIFPSVITFIGGAVTAFLLGSKG